MTTDGGLALIDLTRSNDTIAGKVRRACRDLGFFYIVGHGVDPERIDRLSRLSRRFFALDEEVKLEIRMARGGRAWRGYFPVGAELTSGAPDAKQGLYFGAELAVDDPRVLAGTPLHGPNLFPAQIPELAEAVLGYMEAMTQVGHRVMAAIATSLGLPSSYFFDRYTREPLILFRIFNYPSLGKEAGAGDWSVGEHTDYGLLTILHQDDRGGLQVRSPKGWIEAPPVPDSFVVNLGDMLDRMTGGLYRSTPHRVRNSSGRDRLSFPFFFDPSWDAVVQPIDTAHVVEDDREDRWDGASVHAFRGTYGEYLLGKVSAVFPDLRRDVLKRD